MSRVAQAARLSQVVAAACAILLCACHVSAPASSAAHGALPASTQSSLTATSPGPIPAATAGPPLPATARPNAMLTPGDVFPTATVAQICVSGYSSRVRDVSEREKDDVYAEYGIAHHTTGEYEVDHLVPLEIGGSNDIKNLWPEPALPAPGFHQKDVLENKLHDLVCAGRLDLATAQHAIASDWYAAYLQYVQP
jgi:hypothetical protein